APPQALLRHDGLQPALPDLVPAHVPLARRAVPTCGLDVSMGVRSPDDCQARDGGLLAAERRRLPAVRVRDPGAGATERVPPPAPRRFGARAARTPSRPV